MGIHHRLLGLRPVRKPQAEGRKPSFSHFCSFGVWVLEPDLEHLGCVWCVWCVVDPIWGRIRARRPLAEQKRPQSRCVFPCDTTHIHKFHPHIFMEGPSGILHEPWWSPGRRPRAGERKHMKINKTWRSRTLRFSLWKPSPFALILEASAFGFRITSQSNCYFAK